MDTKTRNGLITLGVVAILGYVAIKFMNMKKESMSGGKKGGSKDDDNNDDNENTNTPPTPPKQDDLNYTSLANKIFTAMDGYGTNEDEVMSVMKQLRNQSDFDKLKKAFGNRTISSGRGNIFVSDFRGELVGAIYDELDAESITEINNILKTKGIKSI
jgi:hypothetical protein